MIYQEFIKLVEKQGNERVKALEIKESCSTNQLPRELLYLFPSLIKTLEQSQLLCSSEQAIVLFGLQPCTMAFCSNFPVTSKRILDLGNPFKHLCCVLQYFLTTKKTLPRKVNWQRTQTLVIDFTTGFLMDDQFYCTKFFSMPPQGLIYGMLNQKKLDFVWKLIVKKGIKTFQNHGQENKTRINS